MLAIRSYFAGLGIAGYDSNVQTDPGETRTVAFVADKPGVFPLYYSTRRSAQ